MRLVDLRGLALTDKFVNQQVPRAALDITEAQRQIAPLLEKIKVEGESAVVAAALEFDLVDPRPLRVSRDELQSSQDALSADLRAAIEESIRRVRAVSLATLPKPSTTELAPGALVHQRWQPVESVGLYVPGGKAVYPSSVVMNVVPAQVAGVPRLAIVTPPQKEFGGRPHPIVLATAAILGVDEVYNIGGPAAIAALTYGIESAGLNRVAMVTGPGNIFVAAAKRSLRGEIGIDSEAGTTEILIVADQGADARLIAFDLVSQAEHDEAAACVLVTDCELLATNVIKWVSTIVTQASNAQRASSALSGVQSAVVLVGSKQDALSFANFYATEHLELLTEDPTDDAKAIKNAGALFLGPYSPVSLGDYLAGSNHVLPTGEQAKFGSGLGVHTFLRAQQLIDYSKEGLLPLVNQAKIFSASEGLSAHGDAVAARFD